MAEKKNSFLGFISFISLVGISIVLILTLLFGANLGAIGEVIKMIAYLVAIGLVAYNAFFYVKNKPVGYMIAYIIAILLVIIHYVVPVIRK